MAQPTQLDPAEQDALVKQIGMAMLRAAPEDWDQITIDYRAIGRYFEADGEIVYHDDEAADWPVPSEIAAMFARLRTGMYRQGRGTWFNARYRLDHPSSYNLDYDREEPEWRMAPPPQSYADDLQLFPRSDTNTPDWLTRRAAGGTRFRVARVFDGQGVSGRPMVNRPPVSERDRADLLAYLNAAPVVSQTRALEIDHLDPDGRVLVPVAFHTDGAWIWPAAVNYYLHTYGVSPEPDLVDHIRRAGFQVPMVDDPTRAGAAAHISRTAPAPRPGMGPTQLMPSGGPALVGSTPPGGFSQPGPPPAAMAPGHPMPVGAGGATQLMPPAQSAGGDGLGTPSHDSTRLMAPGQFGDSSPDGDPLSAAQPLTPGNPTFGAPQPTPGGQPDSPLPFGGVPASAQPGPAGQSDISMPFDAPLVGAQPAPAGQPDNSVPFGGAPAGAQPVPAGQPDRPTPFGVPPAGAQPVPAGQPGNPMPFPTGTTGLVPPGTPPQGVAQLDQSGNPMPFSTPAEGTQLMPAGSVPQPVPPGQPGAPAPAGSPPRGVAQLVPAGQPGVSPPGTARWAPPPGFADAGPQGAPSPGPRRRTAATPRPAGPPPAALPTQGPPAVTIDALHSRLGALGVPTSAYRIGPPAERTWTMDQTPEGWRVGWYDRDFVAPAMFEDVGDAAAFLLGKILLDANAPTPHPNEGPLHPHSRAAAPAPVLPPAREPHHRPTTESHLHPGTPSEGHLHPGTPGEGHLHPGVPSEGHLRSDAASPREGHRRPESWGDPRPDHPEPESPHLPPPGSWAGPHPDHPAPESPHLSTPENWAAPHPDHPAPESPHLPTPESWAAPRTDHPESESARLAATDSWADSHPDHPESGVPGVSTPPPWTEGDPHSDNFAEGRRRLAPRSDRHRYSDEGLGTSDELAPRDEGYFLFRNQDEGHHHPDSPAPFRSGEPPESFFAEYTESDEGRPHPETPSAGNHHLSTSNTSSAWDEGHLQSAESRHRDADDGRRPSPATSTGVPYGTASEGYPQLDAPGESHLRSPETAETRYSTSNEGHPRTESPGNAHRLATGATGSRFGGSDEGHLRPPVKSEGDRLPEEPPASRFGAPETPSGPTGFGESDDFRGPDGFGASDGSHLRPGTPGEGRRRLGAAEEERNDLRPDGPVQPGGAGLARFGVGIEGRRRAGDRGLGREADRVERPVASPGGRFLFSDTTTGVDEATVEATPVAAPVREPRETREAPANVTTDGGNGAPPATQRWPIQPLHGEPPLTLFRGKRMIELPAGTEVDRFGDGDGNLTYAAGTPFSRRSLVPEWVERPFHTYRVARPMQVLSGAAIPWFDQAGGGTAYLLPAAVDELLADGSLVEVSGRKPPLG
jgi:hypothetical protein